LLLAAEAEGLGYGWTTRTRLAAEAEGLG